MSGVVRRFAYVSRSRLPRERIPAELARIASKSADANGVRDITGALVSSGRYFAQIVEGPASAVESLKSQLLKDDRHEKIVVLREEDALTRRFHGWSLVYNGQASYVDNLLARLHQGEAEEHDVSGLAHFMAELATG